MIENVTPEHVIVNRRGTDQRATTSYAVYQDRVDKEGQVIGKGDLLGYAVRLENKQIVYAQPEQIKPA
jgi:hypothetical protein